MKFSNSINIIRKSSAEEKKDKLAQASKRKSFSDIKVPKAAN